MDTVSDAAVLDNLVMIIVVTYVPGNRKFKSQTFRIEGPEVIFFKLL